MRSSHDECREYLRTEMAAKGIEVTVSSAPPIIRTAYATESFVCPHGTAYWLEPTSDQIASWVRDGVR